MEALMESPLHSTKRVMIFALRLNISSPISIRRPDLISVSFLFAQVRITPPWQPVASNWLLGENASAVASLL